MIIKIEDYINKEDPQIIEISPITESEKELFEKSGDLELAEEAFKLALTGNAVAMWELGLVYANNDIHDKSIYWFEKGADLGNVEARYFLASEYIYGYGSDSDYYIGIAVIHSLAKNGHSLSQHLEEDLGITEEKMREMGIPEKYI